MIIRDWRSGKGGLRPRDPPFEHPTEDLEYEDEDEESSYHPTEARRSRYDEPPADANTPYSENRYSNPPPPSIPPMSFTPSPAQGGYSSPTNSRPSMDVYGAFSDPAPSGYSPGAGPAQTQEQQDPRLSRTMQYADPYAAIRATINPPPQPPAQSVPPPPSYSFEGRY